LVASFAANNIAFTYVSAAETNILTCSGGAGGAAGNAL
jgi:hypothetical protein